jgi:hypothetical protein
MLPMKLHPQEQGASVVRERRPTVLKLLSSIIGGLIVAFLIVFATDTLFHLLSSSAAVPPDTRDREVMRAYMARQPASILVAMLAGWAVAAFAGSAIAARFGERGRWPGWVVGSLFLLATASNFVMVPHPAWMVAAGLLAIVIAAWLGSRVGARSHAPAALHA